MPRYTVTRLERHGAPELLMGSKAVQGLACTGAGDQALGTHVREHAQQQLIAQRRQASKPCRGCAPQLYLTLTLVKASIITTGKTRHEGR